MARRRVRFEEAIRCYFLAPSPLLRGLALGSVIGVMSAGIVVVAAGYVERSRIGFRGFLELLTVGYLLVALRGYLAYRLVRGVVERCGA
jgi:hypothetical protein